MAPHPSPRSDSERGIALVAAVLVVLISSLLIVTFMATTVGERELSSNTHTAKKALYAADAGVRVVEQDLANKAEARYDSLVAIWNNAGATGQIMSNAVAANFFANGIVSVQTATTPPYSANAYIKFASDTIVATKQTYLYRYTITSTGSAGLAGARKVQSDGVILLSATRGSFANYLMFLQQQTMADGSSIWFTSSTSMDGRVHANGMMHFAFKPTFQDLVTSTASNAMFQNNGNPVTLSANNNGTIDVPQFFNGFQRGVANVPLPTNAYNQQAWALNSANSAVTTQFTNSQINSALGLGSGTGAPANGIYVPNNGLTGTNLQATGGIYIQGDVSTCQLWADTTLNKQWYQITVGSSTKTICVDRNGSPQTTKVWNSATYTGSPAATYYNALPVGILYVNGGINSLTGPGRDNQGNVKAAVAEGTNLLITTQKDIVVQSDVTVDSYAKNDAVLGLYTVCGGVRVGTSAPNDCNLDAFVMATATNSTTFSGWSSNYPGQFAVDSYDQGSARGTFHLRGGIVEQYYGPFFTFNSTSGALLTGFSRDYHYDRRGLIPTGFPTTTVFTPGAPSARTIAWKEI